MNFRKNRRSHAAALQMSSLMDVVFLLLCFFMSANEFSRWETEVGITLPTAKSATVPGRMPGEIILNLDAKGDVTVNGAKLSLVDVTERLARIAENFPGQPVIIRADKSSSYETLMALIDACRTANVWNFSLATKDEKKEGK
ncbi:MAG: biopolymer transporter ExbD [Kiritimatiellae bacterium]|nr:biopolymer transporter ExbD [Kiritimatiellia bacterium]